MARVAGSLKSSVNAGQLSKSLYGLSLIHI